MGSIQAAVLAARPVARGAAVAAGCERTVTPL
jgi:hypothetical protein